MGGGKCFLSRPYCIFFAERKICVSYKLFLMLHPGLIQRIYWCLSF